MDFDGDLIDRGPWRYVKLRVIHEPSYEVRMAGAAQPVTRRRHAADETTPGTRNDRPTKRKQCSRMSCIGWSGVPSGAKPSMVVTSAPSHCSASMVHDF